MTSRSRDLGRSQLTHTLPPPALIHTASFSSPFLACGRRSIHSTVVSRVPYEAWGVLLSLFTFGNTRADTISGAKRMGGG